MTANSRSRLRRTAAALAAALALTAGLAPCAFADPANWEGDAAYSWGSGYPEWLDASVTIGTTTFRLPGEWDAQVSPDGNNAVVTIKDDASGDQLATVVLHCEDVHGTPYEDFTPTEVFSYKCEQASSDGIDAATRVWSPTRIDVSGGPMAKASLASFSNRGLSVGNVYMALTTDGMYYELRSTIYYEHVRDLEEMVDVVWRSASWGVDEAGGLIAVFTPAPAEKPAEPSPAAPTPAPDPTPTASPTAPDGGTGGAGGNGGTGGSGNPSTADAGGSGTGGSGANTDPAAGTGGGAGTTGGSGTGGSGASTDPAGGAGTAGTGVVEPPAPTGGVEPAAPTPSAPFDENAFKAAQLEAAQQSYSENPWYNPYWTIIGYDCSFDYSSDPANPDAIDEIYYFRTVDGREGSTHGMTLTNTSYGSGASVSFFDHWALMLRDANGDMYYCTCGFVYGVGRVCDLAYYPGYSDCWYVADTGAAVYTDWEGDWILSNTPGEEPWTPHFSDVSGS